MRRMQETQEMQRIFLCASCVSCIKFLELIQPRSGEAGKYLSLFNPSLSKNNHTSERGAPKVPSEPVEEANYKVRATWEILRLKVSRRNFQPTPSFAQPFPRSIRYCIPQSEFCLDFGSNCMDQLQIFIIPRKV